MTWARIGRLSSLGLWLWACDALAQPVIYDTVESGTLTTGQAPPGQWTATYQVRAGNSLSASSSAARRGGFGIRMVDNYSGVGSEWEGELNRAFAPLTGNLYVRTWLRLSNTNSLGDAFVLSVSTSLNPPNAAQVRLRYPGPLIQLVHKEEGGSDTYSPGTPFEEGTWQLVELGVVGLGTATGSARLWLNGTLVAQVNNLDWSSTSADKIKTGALWANDLRFTGTIDWDDFRADRSPLASQLTLSTTVPSPDIGACVPVQVQLRDAVSGSLAPAVETTAVALGSSVGTDAFFSDAACTAVLTEVEVPTSGSTAAAYWKPTSDGLRTLSAQSLDFLSGSTQVTVPTPPPPDAGTPDGGSADGGSPAGGSPDAGSPLDAGGTGLSDGGEPSSPDGEPPPPDEGAVLDPHALRLGCGCGAGGAPMWLLALGALTLLLRANGR